MSSILDALKRLEKEVPDQSIQNLEPSWLDAPSVNASLKDRLSGILLRKSRAICIAGAIGLFIAGAAIMVKIGVFPLSLSKPDVQPLKEAAPAEGVKVQAAPDVPVRTTIKNLHRTPTRQNRSPLEKAGPVARGNVLEARQKTVIADPPGAVPPVRTVKPEKKQVVSGTRSPPSASAVPEAAPKKEAVRPDKAPPDAAVEDARVEKASPTQELSRNFAQNLPSQAGLDLQAISWDEEPESRIAVINGRIMREGERIEGYLLSEINPDDVLFEHTGQIWKLEFRQR
ncbi:MAG: general secretion pathway protein GspB [Desulfobacterales bacterium]|nr:general secretion pathway protein GspB [Desulfobacterales bacterium]